MSQSKRKGVAKLVGNVTDDFIKENIDCHRTDWYIKQIRVILELVSDLFLAGIREERKEF